MCGIAGKFNFDSDRPVSADLIRRMTDVIAHRGPDGEGHYVRGPIGLGHRRLAIIDLSPAGAQPMCNEDGTVWITFNGEIYNYREIRQRLITRGHVLRSETDTEAIVHLWEDHGIECLEHLRGMFAFAIWDANRRALFIARDRIGIKPLYYAGNARSLTFASEIKALLVDRDVSRDVSLAAVDRFLTYLYLPGPGTMFEHVRKLEPGHYLLANAEGVVCRQYWDLTFRPDQRWKRLDEAAEAVGALLRDTVRDHMVSDVPVGFLASGGVDSTALLSYAVENTSTPIQTFTVGFSGSEVVDERPYARLAAERFGTTHREVTISADDFGAFLPRYVWHMEEPVCEPPAIALYYVSQLARSHVKVLLSGEGGDEAFGGYPEYRNYPAFERWKRRTAPIGGAVRAALSIVAGVTGNRRIQKYSQCAGRSVPDYYYSRTTSPHDCFNRLRPALYADDFAAAVSGADPTAATRTLFEKAASADLLNQLLYVDSKTWLPDDLLIKADKITMATSLELRVPFLDHKVLELAATLPVNFKVNGRTTKRVLKRAFTGRVPDAILGRKKAGFPVPYAKWLDGELRDFVHGTILSSRAMGRGYFSRKRLESLTALNDADTGSSSREVFSLLILELWHQVMLEGAVQTAPVDAAPRAVVVAG